MTVATHVLGALVLFSIVMLIGATAPPQEAYERCYQIGHSSGCSGCNAANVACQWCASPTNDFSGVCAPEPFCSHYKTAGGVDYIPRPHLCPSNLTEEKPYGGKDVGVSSKLFSPSFDSHYCEFPHQPWSIDRSSNPFGNRDPNGNCYRVNNQLAVGQLTQLTQCIYGLKRDAEAATNRLSPKQQECIRVYQSYLCTSSCPEYGVAMDFDNVCSDYCDRLFQHCDATLLQCLYASQPLPFGRCASPNADKCFRPKLIEPSHKFEYDLCFSGNPDRCNTQDCVVELAKDTDTWPTDFSCYGTYGNGIAFSPTQTGPACCTAGYFGHNGWLYNIVKRGTAGGLTCEQAVRIDAINRWAGRYDHTHGELCYGNHCAAVVDIGTGSPSKPDINGCKSNSDLYNCPAFVRAIYSEGPYTPCGAA